MQNIKNSSVTSSSGLQNLMSNYCSDGSSDLEEGEIVDTEDNETVSLVQQQSDSVPTKLCCVCSKEKSSYKCPGCSRVYCSVDCCKQHKDNFDCDGKRNKIPYVSLGGFDQKQFLDDYFFLEEVDQKIDKARRTVASLKNIGVKRKWFSFASQKKKQTKKRRSGGNMKN